MLKSRISTIVADCVKQTTREEKVHFLRQHDCLPLRICLGLAVDKKVRWALPPGAPPYKPSDQTDNEMGLYHEAPKLDRYFEGAHPNLKQRRREELFITLLESLHAEDAKFLIEVVINKQLPEGLSKAIVKDAFPDMKV